jgi:[ribosomal protein S5]-alanine N-acetyltransferase
MTPHLSARLRFEPLQETHAAQLADALLDPRVYAFISGEHPTTQTELAHKFAKTAAGPPPHFVGETWWNFAVFEIASGTGIGLIEATLIDSRAEVGYMFAPAFWGRGFAFEALDWLHARLAATDTVTELWATVMPGNERSAHLLRRFGYVEHSGPRPMLASYDDGDWVFQRQLRL